MTHRDDKYRLAVRALPCTLNVAGVACPTGPSVLAHRNEGKGIGLKTDDLGAAACPACHYAVDQGRDLSREDRRYYLDRGTIRTVTELLRRGWLGWTVSKRDLEREIQARVA